MQRGHWKRSDPTGRTAQCVIVRPIIKEVRMSQQESDQTSVQTNPVGLITSVVRSAA
jgi:hypothetical protein